MLIGLVYVFSEWDAHRKDLSAKPATRLQDQTRLTTIE